MVYKSSSKAMASKERMDATVIKLTQNDMYCAITDMGTAVTY